MIQTWGRAYNKCGSAYLWLSQEKLVKDEPPLKLKKTSVLHKSFQGCIFWTTETSRALRKMTHTPQKQDTSTAIQKWKQSIYLQV